MTKTIKLHVEFDITTILSDEALEVLRKDRAGIFEKIIPQLEEAKAAGTLDKHKLNGLNFFKSLEHLDEEAYAVACIKKGVRDMFAEGFNSDGTFKVSPLKFTNTTTHKEKV